MQCHRTIRTSKPSQGYKSLHGHAYFQSQVMRTSTPYDVTVCAQLPMYVAQLRVPTYVAPVAYAILVKPCAPPNRHSPGTIGHCTHTHMGSSTVVLTACPCCC